MKYIIHHVQKLRMVDYIVGLCLLFVVVGSLLLFTRKQTTILIDITSFPQEGNVNPFPPQYTEISSFAVGDASYNGVGKKTSEIIAIDKLDWQSNRKTVRMTVRLNVVYDPRTHQYAYDDTPILVGGKFTLTTNRSVFNGQIINVYTSEADRYKNYTRRSGQVIVNIRFLEDWQAQSLKNFMETDSNGVTLAKTRAIAITPAEIDVHTDKGVVYKGYSTIYKDVRLTLDIDNILCADQTCYFNGLIPLKVGGKFWTQSNTALIDEGFIVDFTLNK